MNELVSIEKSEFDVYTLDDEIRVDALCSDLLRTFYRYLLGKNIPAGEATALASGADYFTRDFVIARKQKNILDIRPGTVRQFAGNWYIANTLEPNIRELSGHLAGVKAFYGFLRECGIIADEILLAIEKECDDGDYYEDRIESFWEIQGDGYFAWDRECTLKDD
jgi:hypothetical protein